MSPARRAGVFDVARSLARDLRERNSRGSRMQSPPHHGLEWIPFAVKNERSMARSLPKIILKNGREKSLLRRHPWVFSGAIERVDGAPASGDTVDIVDSAVGTVIL